MRQKCDWQVEEHWVSNVTGVQWKREIYDRWANYRGSHRLNQLKSCGLWLQTWYFIICNMKSLENFVWIWQTLNFFSCILEVEGLQLTRMDAKTSLESQYIISGEKVDGGSRKEWEQVGFKCVLKVVLMGLTAWGQKGSQGWFQVIKWWVPIYWDGNTWGKQVFEGTERASFM
jgi:hypothetical protein